MLEQPVYAADDAAVRSLVLSRAWGTLVTGTPTPVVSHLPIVLENDDDLTVITHVARADAELHQLGDHDVVLVVEGPDGYVSPTFYETGTVRAHVELRRRPPARSPRAAGPRGDLGRAGPHRRALRGPDRPVPWRLDTVDGLRALDRAVHHRLPALRRPAWSARPS